MGFSHSVHILMAINFWAMARALANTYRPQMERAIEAMPATSAAEVKKQELVMNKPTAETDTAGNQQAKDMSALYRFRERARRLKASFPGAFVVLHCFAGSRRVGDFAEWMQWWAEQCGIMVMVESADFAFSEARGLSCPVVIALLY